MSLISEAMRKARVEAALRDSGEDPVPASVSLRDERPGQRRSWRATLSASAGGLVAGGIILGFVLWPEPPVATQANWVPPVDLPRSSQRAAAALARETDRNAARSHAAGNWATEPVAGPDRLADLAAGVRSHLTGLPDVPWPTRDATETWLRESSNAASGYDLAADYADWWRRLGAAPSSTDQLAAAPATPAVNDPADEEAQASPGEQESVTSGPSGKLFVPSSLLESLHQPNEPTDDKPSPVVTDLAPHDSASEGAFGRKLLEPGKTYTGSLDVLDAPVLVLDGITWSDNAHAAVINGMLLYPGQYIEGVRIIKVERSRLTLRLNEIEFYLQLR